MSNRYVNEFVSLKCAPLVLETVGHLGNKPDKEISEAMGLIKRIKKFTLKSPDKFQVVDLCSGNALVPVIAAHLLPITKSYAIDKLNRKRQWNVTKNFEYHITDIFDNRMHKFFQKPTILTAVHSCKTLAEKAINIFNKYDHIKYLALMPCCQGSLDNSILQFIRSESSSPVAWTLKLALQCNGSVNVYKDKYIISPRNHIITSKKRIGE
jgi:hypothetical protein